jgi:hypothetical protein
MPTSNRTIDAWLKVNGLSKRQLAEAAKRLKIDHLRLKTRRQNRTPLAGIERLGMTAALCGLPAFEQAFHTLEENELLVIQEAGKVISKALAQARQRTYDALPPPRFKSADHRKSRQRTATAAA